MGTGNSFLEKIIQVPLQIPSIESEDLRTFYFNEIDQVLSFSDISINEEDAQKFAYYFSKSLESHLKTPRQAKLYSNILMFSLPILKNEANIVDLMLIEGIRVLLPNVYTLIRDNSELFLSDGTGAFNDDEKEKQKRIERIEAAILQENFVDEKKQVKDLLCFLFPKLNKVFRNSNYGSEWETKWSETQRICSPQYFQRYFTYAITNKDVSDTALNELLKYSESHSTDDIVKKIRTIMTVKNSSTLISKLRRLSNKMTTTQSKKLAVSIAMLGNDLPNPVQMFRSTNTFGQGAMFTGDCIENLKIREEEIQLS